MKCTFLVEVHEVELSSVNIHSVLLKKISLPHVNVNYDIQFLFSGFFLKKTCACHTWASASDYNTSAEMLIWHES